MYFSQSSQELSFQAGSSKANHSEASCGQGRKGKRVFQSIRLPNRDSMNKQSRALSKIKSVPESERDNILCLVGSRDGRFGSLVLPVDLAVSTCRLEAGEVIEYRVEAGRTVLLFCMSGTLVLNADERLTLPSASALRCGGGRLGIQATQDSEFLFLEMGGTEDGAGEKIGGTK